MGYDELLFHEQYAVIMFWTASNSMNTCNNSLFRSSISAPAAKFTITLQYEVFYLPTVQLLIKSWFITKFNYWFYHPIKRHKDKLYYYGNGSEPLTITDKLIFWLVLAYNSIDQGPPWPVHNSIALWNAQFHCCLQHTASEPYHGTD